MFTILKTVLLIVALAVIGLAMTVMPPLDSNFNTGWRWVCFASYVYVVAYAALNLFWPTVETEWRETPPVYLLGSPLKITIYRAFFPDKSTLGYYSAAEKAHTAHPTATVEPLTIWTLDGVYFDDVRIIPRRIELDGALRATTYETPYGIQPA